MRMRVRHFRHPATRGDDRFAAFPVGYGAAVQIRTQRLGKMPGTLTICLGKLVGEYFAVNAGREIAWPTGDRRPYAESVRVVYRA